MKKTPRQQIDELAAMDVAALRMRHMEFFGKETTCAHRQFLFRKLAWHLQARAEGGLPESTIELADSIARGTPLRARVLTNEDRRRAGLPEDKLSTTTVEPGHDPRTPMPGGLIVKQYRGRTRVVTVLGYKTPEEFRRALATGPFFAVARIGWHGRARASRPSPAGAYGGLDPRTRPRGAQPSRRQRKGTKLYMLMGGERRQVTTPKVNDA